MKTSFLSALLLLAAIPFVLHAQTATNAAPSAPVAPADAAPASPDDEKALKAKLADVSKKAMADPAVKEAYKAANDAGKSATAQTNQKMKELDPSSAQLIDRDPKQPISPIDKQKLAELKKKALQDPAIKASHTQAGLLSKQAQELRIAKIKEIDPSLAPLVDKPAKKESPKAKPAAPTAPAQ
jgi:hypothetical protein